jgi:hypothetical protein
MRALTPLAPVVRTAALVAALLASSATGAAPLRASLVEAKALKLDGIPKEWPTAGVALTHAVRGAAPKSDLSATGFLAYDQTRIFVGADVTDDALRAGSDRVTLVLGFPGGATYEVELYPGEPGKTAARAMLRGAPIAGAKVIEAPREGGWSLEASVPWSTFAEAATTRVGLRGGLFVYDADHGAAIESVVGTSPSTSYAALAPLATEPEQGLAEGLLRDKGLSDTPQCSLLIDVVGDAMLERVLVFDRYLVVLGPTYRGGKEYYFSDLEAGGAMLPTCEARELTGDGKAELVFRKRLGTPTRYREVLHVLSFGPNGASDVPSPIFMHEVGLVSDKKVVDNGVEFTAAGGKSAIVIDAGRATGFDAGSYREPTETSIPPLLLPWGTTRSVTYAFTGKKFTKTGETTQAATPAPAAPSAPVAAPSARPASPPPPSAAELQRDVLALYKREQRAVGAARFDVVANVAGDAQPERVLLWGRDLVLFGKGYRGGTGYAFLTLAQFAAESDILEVTTRDLTGDGRAEILVKGRLHGTAPEGAVEREVLLVYRATPEGLVRIFAAETARAIGGKRVAASVELSNQGLTLSPGRATGWTEKTYPFNQDVAPVGGYEPLPLPWGGAKAARYRWTGAAFARQ